MDQAVVLVGNFSDGYKIYGPFEDMDAATDACGEHDYAETWVSTLHSPQTSDSG